MCIQIESVQEILSASLTVVGGVVGIAAALWCIRVGWELHQNAQAIRQVQDECDAVEASVNARTRGHLVNESQRIKMIEKERAPLKRKLERLKEERQLIKDKLLFVKK